MSDVVPHRPPLDRDRIATEVSALDGDSGPPGGCWRVEVVERTGSTHADLGARVRAGGCGVGAVLVTDHQVTGRGRLERVWEVPFGAALTFSAAVAMPGPSTRWSWLPLLAGVAVHRTLQPLLGDRVGLKWPNDVMVSERKLAGILAELVPGAEGTTGSMLGLLGIGLNVDTRTSELPVPHATSLALSGVRVDRESLLAGILGELGAVLRAPEAEQQAAYREACVTVGRAVAVLLPGGDRVDGEAVGVDRYGRLEVRTDAGTRAFAAGDVVHVRPSEA